ncbi:MAG TPA: LysM domain-containing protein, partial [Phycisphaerae bacterium]|nr:LysM domain-containing protein [Phycisphaerae bacterium]
LESQIHGMAHETEGSEQNVQEAQDQSPSAPVVTQAVYLSVQQAGAPEPPPQDNSVTPDVLEVIDPELIAATQNKIEKARELIDQGDIPGARETLNGALEQISDLDIPEASEIRQTLMQINKGTLLGTGVLPSDSLAKMVTVEQGDTIDYLADLYRISVAELLNLNPQIDPDQIQVGTMLKVLLGPFDARLVLHAARLDIYDGKMYILSYNVEFMTPVLPSPGEYNILQTRFWSDHATNKQDTAGGEVIIEPSNDNSGQQIVLAGPVQNNTDIGISADNASELIRLLSLNYSHMEVSP